MGMTQDRKHTPITEGEDGLCWCGVQHHCCHIIPGTAGSEEICCLCGDILTIQKAPHETHGPWAYWLYEPVKTTPKDDVCKGARTPPEDFDLGVRENNVYQVAR